MQNQTPEISIGQLAASLRDIRRRVVETLDAVQKIGREQREQRKTRSNWALIGRAECAGMGPLIIAHEQRIAAQLAGHSADLVRTGNEILQLSLVIDAHSTGMQRVDLLGAGRRFLNASADTPFASLVGMSLECPLDRRGRKVAGPLFIAMVSACGAAMKHNAAALQEAERHAAERVAAAGFIFAAPATLQ